MILDPLKALLRSRKFLTLLLDVVLSTVLFFVGKYATPELFEDIQFLIGAYQPVFLFIIGAIAYEDGAQLKAGVHPAQAPKE